MARDQVWNSCIWPGDLGNDWTENSTAKMPAEGEWKVGGLPSAFYGALSLGMSGYPCFGSDIGGYRGGLSTDEVLLRWLELGIFHPVTQLGGAGSAHMPWVDGSPYSAEAVAVTRDLLQAPQPAHPLRLRRDDPGGADGRALRAEPLVPVSRPRRGARL